MVRQCSKLFYYKVSSDFLRQDSQSSWSFGKIKNVGETELSEENNLVFRWRKISYFVFIYRCQLLLSLNYIWKPNKHHFFYELPLKMRNILLRRSKINLLLSQASQIVRLVLHTYLKRDLNLISRLCINSIVILVLQITLALLTFVDFSNGMPKLFSNRRIYMHRS